MRFDTHLHVWWRGDGAGIRIRSNMPELDRDFSFPTVRPMLAAAGVSRALLVSSAQQEDDNDRLQAVGADNADIVAGVIGWLDLEAPGVAARIAHYGSSPLWRGVRLPLTIHEDRRHVTRPAVRRGLAALAKAGAAAEILAAPGQLADVAAVLADLPGLTAIIDHAGTPDFTAPPTAEWCDGIVVLAALPGTICKVSAFWVPGDPPVADRNALPFFAHIAATFGPERMIAAANWPVSSLAGPYDQSWRLLDRLAAAAGLDADAKRAIMAGNAQRLFEKPATG
jgi:L-fuconolactonase